MKTIFKIAIGDWSGDGHDKCNYYQVQSDKSLNHVREMHYKIKAFTGVDVEKICSEYEDTYVSKDVEDKLRWLGFDFSKTESFMLDKKRCLGTKDCCKIWIFLLNHVDSELNLKIMDEPKIPMLQFSGFDKKGRYIDGPGYGCFDR